jgi:hypothetical protein
LPLPASSAVTNLPLHIDFNAIVTLCFIQP